MRVNIKIIKPLSRRSKQISRLFTFPLWTQVRSLIIIPLVFIKRWLILLSTYSNYSTRWTVWCLNLMSTIVPTVIWLVRCWAWAWDNINVAWHDFTVGDSSTLWTLISLTSLLRWIMLWRYIPSLSGSSKVLRVVSVLRYPCSLWHHWSIR